jgi:hypothetical protein
MFIQHSVPNAHTTCLHQKARLLTGEGNAALYRLRVCTAFFSVAAIWLLAICLYYQSNIYNEQLMFQGIQLSGLCIHNWTRYIKHMSDIFPFILLSLFIYIYIYIYICI